MGTYTANGSQLTLEIGATTRAACPPGSLSEKYLQYLNDVVSYVFQDCDLYLALKMDAGIMKFTTPASPVGESLSGVVWQWQEFQSSDDTLVKPENPAAYTLEFLADGALAVGADLLGLEFSAGPRGVWTLVGAAGLPDLRLGGDAFLDALASVLSDGQGARR